MKTKAMNDDTMLDLIDTVSDVIDDHIIDGYDQVAVVSVLLAVIIKRLKLALTEDDFKDVLKDISKYELYVTEDTQQIEIKDYSDSGIKKRTIH